MLTWIEAAILVGYGLVLTASGLPVQVGVMKAAAHADRLAMKWHAYLWDPWFLIWGIFVFLALWRSRPGSQDHLPGRHPGQSRVLQHRAGEQLKLAGRGRGPNEDGLVAAGRLERSGAGSGEQQHQPLAQQHRVLGQRRPHGSFAAMIVGPPDGDSTLNLPSTPRTRSASPVRPAPFALAPPTPSSLTMTVSVPGYPCPSTHTFAQGARECLATFASASATTKHAMASTAGFGRTGTLTCMVTGTGHSAATRDSGFLRSLGADEVVTYDSDPWTEPVDVVLDGAGGDVLPQSVAAMAPGGRLVFFASVAAPSRHSTCWQAPK